MTLAHSSHPRGLCPQLLGEHHLFRFLRARKWGTSQMIILAPQLVVAVACDDHPYD